MLLNLFNLNLLHGFTKTLLEADIQKLNEIHRSKSALCGKPRFGIINELILHLAYCIFVLNVLQEEC